MRRDTRLAISIILLFSSLCIGMLGCMNAPILYWNVFGDPDYSLGSADAKWRKLPMPPSQVKEIISADYFTVYVRTEDANILGCYQESKLDQQCWFTVDQLPALPRMEPDRQSEGLFPDPPDGLVVIQEYQVYYPDGRDTDTSSAFFYLIDGEGQVWQWGYERFLYFGPPKVMRISLLASLVGLSFGSMLPFLLLLLLWRSELFSLFKFVQDQQRFGRAVVQD